MSVKIQYASDLHIEFRENSLFLAENPLQVKGDVMILSGDIVPFVLIEKHKDFFKWLADNFEQTYWIPGNHEYYNSDLTDREGSFCEKLFQNVSLINNTTVKHEDVHLICSTLWSFITPQNMWIIKHSLNDFRAIKYNKSRLTTKDYNLNHKSCLSFIEAELEKLQGKNTVVTTHHVPTFMNYPEEYKGDALNEAFAVELFNLIENFQPNYWIYGHTHRNTPTFQIGDTSLVTNQLGYVQLGEHTSFEVGKSFEV